MTDEQRLQLSALQDGELDAASTSRLLDAVARESSLRATWERYHLIGLAIRNEHIDLTHRDLAERVRRALSAEPVPLTQHRRHRWLHARRPVVGVALAATLALVALFAAPVLFQPVPTNPTPAAFTPTFAGYAPLPDRHWRLDRPELASKLDRFLVTHQATAPATGAKGMLPYATLVGYDEPR